ncbi:ashwin [Anomaloglossus baeobatrachus]|uniref:ashwin n=1 Tax=Anomaloglossus baeobatrachus TaxID=238106 RepID=UPI003F5035BD
MGMQCLRFALSPISPSSKRHRFRDSRDDISGGRRVLWEGLMMAAVGGRSGGQEGDFLLHPELLSRDFLLLSLGQKNIVVQDAVNDKEKLTEIFVQHAMPLPQRQLPKSRWGKLMESKRGVKKLDEPCKKSAENIRKRPLIVFDGASTSTSIKVKKTENGHAAQRLHQSYSETSSTSVRSGAVPTSPVPHQNSSTASKEAKIPTGNYEHSTTTGPGSNIATVKVKCQSPVSGSVVKIKRAAPKDDSDVMNDEKPSEAKKKIHHVTWP